MSINLKNYRQEKKVAKKTNTTSIADFFNQDIELFNSYFNNKIKQGFYANLETLLTAGLDIQNALTLIEEGQKKKATKAIIVQLREAVVDGLALSKAMESVGRFTNYEVQSVRIGEETGRLNIVLDELADFFEKSLKYKRQLIGALSYPFFISSFALAVVYFLLRYLVPMFSGIYGRFDKELPTITQKIVTISEWLQSYSYLVFLGLLGIIIFLYWKRTTVWFRKWSAKLLLRMPIFGSIIKQIYLARFCQSMFLLLSAKVPLLKAVSLVRQMIAFYPIEQALEQSEQGIVQGELLSTMLRKSNFFPNQLLALLTVGEEASRLEQMFSKLAKQYNEGVDQQTEVVGRLIEPVLIIGLGLLVGIILVAMYMPLFQLSTNV
jgi:type IV pilus assembly protein PilC